MWAATWALNTLVSRGKSTDWMVHMIGQSVGAYTNATHGMTLAAVSFHITVTSFLTVCRNLRDLPLMYGM